MRESVTQAGTPGIYKFEAGLRAYGDIGNNMAGLVKCFNLVPRYKKLVAFDPLTPVPGGVTDWPYPQLFCFAHGSYLCGRNYIQELDGSLNLIASYATLEGTTPWKAVDFWQYVVFTNGVAVYVTDTLGGSVIPYVGTALPVMSTLLNYKGQLVAGGVTGYDTNMVVYGAVGYATLLTSADPVEVGQVPMRWNGSITDLRRLGPSNLMVYGSEGMAVLSATYKEVVQAFEVIDALPKSLQRLGVVAVGGDESEQCFLDVTGCLWKVGVDLKPEELGYREFFEPMLGGDIVISMDQRALYRDFYISDGTDCYLLSSQGLCKVHQSPSSIQVYDGAAYSVFADSLLTNFEVETDKIDLASRGKKTTEWLEINQKGVDNVQVKTSEFSSPLFPLSPDGRARAKVYGSEFGFSFTGATYVGAFLSDMTIRWKSGDKSTDRGKIKGVQYVS